MTTNAAAPDTMLEERCRRNGCTGEDCECWLEDDEAEDAKLINAAFHSRDVRPSAYTIEYIDDARMLTVLGAGGEPTRRLYLDEHTGQIESVPLEIEFVVDARDLLDGTTDRRLAQLAAARTAPRYGEAAHRTPR